MIIKLSSKHQITIPKSIAEAFRLRKGDVFDIEVQGNKIVMVPKEMILEDKYPQSDLKGAENTLSVGIPDEEISFKSGVEMEKFLKKRVKK